MTKMVTTLDSPNTRPQGTTVVVTGGARGIGAATALLAAQRGYAVVVVYHTNGRAAQTVVDRAVSNGGTALAVQADVGTEHGVQRLFQTVDERMPPLHGLVNNAGVLAQQMRVEDMGTERLQWVFQTNVIGPFLCAREAVKRLSTRHGGRGGAVVNVSSMAARLGAPNEYVDYAASKGAVDAMTVGLAKEVAAEGIRVNAVRPGVIYTDIHASGGEPNRVDRVKHTVPMGRGGQPEEVAEAICWLLSDQSSYTTGAFIDVAGGR
jgi:NAD(P)-dependent dehydrogenase (short-subunit alcohol dehydrogenase family)